MRLKHLERALEIKKSRAFILGKYEEFSRLDELRDLVRENPSRDGATLEEKNRIAK
jgi:hypothetical protein